MTDDPQDDLTLAPNKAGRPKGTTKLQPDEATLKTIAGLGQPSKPYRRKKGVAVAIRAPAEGGPRRPPCGGKRRARQKGKQ